MGARYREYSSFLATLFDGKIQKISIDLNLGCPNRDGTIGRGGCIYCNNSAFSPDDTKAGLPVPEQIARGKQFFAHKYPHMRYLAYFQSYTGTYAKHSFLIDAYTQALADSDVVGIVIGTRPDCLPNELLAKLQALKEQTKKEILIEFGVETLHDITLRRINRGHSADTAIDAIRRTAAAGFPVGIHLIIGLPGESEQMVFDTITRINSLPISSVKFHQLQILRHTPLAAQYTAGKLTDILEFTPESYADICRRIIAILRPDIAIDRFLAQAPPDLLIYPRWGLKNYQFTALL